MSASPVFVDSTGRRGRWIRRVFWALGLIVSAYIGVVFLALVGPPSLSRLAVPGLGPVLPGSGAPGLRTATGQHGKPAAVLSPRPSTSPRPLVTTEPSSPTPLLTTAPGAASSPSSLPTASPTPGPTVSPSPRATGRPVSPKPRTSQTPPGQASDRPSPRSSHARGGSPQPSPTP